jgi:hypothetical protein
MQIEWCQRQRLVEQLLAEGGFTWRTGVGQPKIGYAVAVSKSYEWVASTSDQTRKGYASVDSWLRSWLLEYAEWHASALRPSGRYVGGWIDKERGLVYFDVVEVVESSAAALALGRERRQVAVYDILNRVCLTLEV